MQSAEAVAAFVGGLRDPSEDVRMVASAGLMNMEVIPEEAHAALVEALRDPEPRVKANAAQVLARVQPLPAGAVPLLVDLTSHAEDSVRISAARTLKAAAPEQLDSLCERLLQDSNVQIQLLAVEHLLAKEPGHAQAMSVLEAILGDFTAPLRKSVLPLIRDLGQNAVRLLDLLFGRLELEEDEQMRSELTKLIESIRATAAVEVPSA
jgi:HEAT repeat protein